MANAGVNPAIVWPVIGVLHAIEATVACFVTPRSPAWAFDWFLLVLGLGVSVASGFMLVSGRSSIPGWYGTHHRGRAPFAFWLNALGYGAGGHVLFFKGLMDIIHG